MSKVQIGILVLVAILVVVIGTYCWQASTEYVSASHGVGPPLPSPPVIDSIGCTPLGPMLVGESVECNPILITNVENKAFITYSWDVRDGENKWNSTANSLTVYWDSIGRNRITLKVTNEGGTDTKKIFIKVNLPEEIYLNEACLWMHHHYIGDAVTEGILPRVSYSYSNECIFESDRYDDPTFRNGDYKFIRHYSSDRTAIHYHDPDDNGGVDHTH